MGQTKIEWTATRRADGTVTPGFTFNPWIGCTKVSPGCEHCYAESWDRRFGGDHWGKGKPRRRTSEANWRKPLKWNKAAACMCAQAMFGNVGHHNDCPQAAGNRPRVFCASLADWLDPEVPIEWLADLLVLIQSTPNITWMMLTKRPEMWRSRMEWALTLLGEFNGLHWGHFEWMRRWMYKNDPPPNVWIGTTVEDQKRADERVPHLLRIPARVRFLSAEPLLGPIDLGKWLVENRHHAKPTSREHARTTSGIRRVDHRLRGAHLASQHPHGSEERRVHAVTAGDASALREAFDDGLPSGAHDVRRKADHGARAPSGVEALPRRDSGRALHQPQEWREGRQPPGEPRTRDLFAEHEPRAQDRSSQPERRAEPSHKTVPEPGSGDTPEARGGRTAEVDRGGLRNQRPDRVKDSARRPLGIHQVIAGGESGPGARPMHPDWARSLRDQCHDAGIAYFHKQNGAYVNGLDYQLQGDDVKPIQHNKTPFVHVDGEFTLWRVGKKAAGRLLDGCTWDEVPHA